MPIITRAENPAKAPSNDARVDPLVALYGKDPGPRTVEFVSTWRNNLGLHAISRRNLTDRLFNFCEGTALGVRFEEKAYESDDAYVTDSPIRKAVCEFLRDAHDNERVAFVEASSLVELGAGFLASGSIAATPYVAVGWSMGVTTSMLARVRQSFPVVLSQRESVDAHLRYKHLDFPFRAQSALNMKAGSEIEMTAQGHVLTNAGIGLAAGLVSRPASAGFGVTFGGAASSKKEINLNILALDKPGHVRVCIRQLSEEAATLMIRMRAGLIFSTGGVTGTLIGGMLRFYSEKLGAPSFEEFVNLFTTLNASIYGGVVNRPTLIGAWDLNLNDPEGRLVYENLMLLNTASASTAISQNKAFIHEILVRENEREKRLGADIGMLGQKIFASENIVTQREGRVTSSSAPSLRYRDSIFTYRKRNIVKGVCEVNWEAVSVKLADEKRVEPHLHLRVEEKDWDFGSHRIDRLVHFGECLGVDKLEMLGRNKEEFAKATRHLQKSEEVTIKCEVYFTKKGISKFDSVTFEEAKNAFLTASSRIFPKVNDARLTATTASALRAKQIVDRYLELHEAGVSKVWDILHHNYLYDDYRELTGRDLKTDSALVLQAKQFAAILTAAQKRESADELAQFFRQLSKKHRIHFMVTVGALGLLAGAKETLVHELSISDNRTTISNVPEPAIENPRDSIARALYGLANPN